MLPRRCFLKGAASAAAAASYPTIVSGAGPRVVIVGAGAGGASVARRLAAAGTGASLSLVEASERYSTCFLSNLYLAGIEDYTLIEHRYDGLRAAGAIDLVRARARAVDVDRRSLVLADGSRIGYDYLVLSPGVEIDAGSVPGYADGDPARAPHAWLHGSEVKALRRLALEMRPGGLFVYVAPPKGSRCPPAAYERVSMLAHLFRTANPKAKIVIIDPKESFPMQTLFQTAWEDYYPGVILWLPASMSGGLRNVDLSTLTFATELEDFDADAASVVPAQRAPALLRESGLTDASGWAPVDARTFASTRADRVYVLGDAALASPMPRSASAAISQADVVAGAIAAALTGTQARPATHDVACWSFVAPHDSIKVGGHYVASASGITGSDTFISSPSEDVATRRRAAEDAYRWYHSTSRHLFGDGREG